MILKLFVVVFAGCIYIINCDCGDDVQKEYDKYHANNLKNINCTLLENCFIESSSSDQLDNFLPRGELDERYKCVFRCVFMKVNVTMDKSTDVLSQDDINKLLNSNRMVRFQEKLSNTSLMECNKILKNDADKNICDPAYNLVNCAVKQWNKENTSVNDTTYVTNFPLALSSHGGDESHIFLWLIFILFLLFGVLLVVLIIDCRKCLKSCCA